MKDVFVCKDCGFVSTLRSEYRNDKGDLVCIDCKEERLTPKTK